MTCLKPRRQQGLADRCPVHELTAKHTNMRHTMQADAAAAIGAAEREVAPLTAERDAAVTRRTAARAAAAQSESALNTRIR